MLGRVREYICQHHMIEPGDRIVAGVSGGADSVCLLLVLHALQSEMDFSLTAVHVEHGLRGKASCEDAKFVEELCKEMQVTCSVFSVDVAEKARMEGLGLEEAGRELRYECFAKVCQEEGANKIAVAHHRDDQAETVLFQLFRGAGLKGLCGMSPQRGNVIRPLLGVSRTEIEEWLRGQGISWRTDATNEEEIYSRNKLRLKVLPYVEQNIQPRAAEHVAQTAEYLRQVEDYLEKETIKAYQACVQENQVDTLRINLKSFWQQEPVFHIRILQRALERLQGCLKDVGAVHLEALLDVAGKESGKQVFLPHGIHAYREYGDLVLKHHAKGEEKDQSDRVFIMTEVPGVYEIQGQKWVFTLEYVKKGQGIPEKTYTKWFDYDKIKQYLSIRNRQPGDYLEINREHGRKKLKDYLIDCKMPREGREKLLILADGSHVVWVPGRRISEAYKVTEQTKRILKVEIFGGCTNDREDQRNDSGRRSGRKD